MRNLALVLALFMFGMMFIPCSDTWAASFYDTDTQQEQVSQQDYNHSHQSGHLLDSCSPFCGCHCCHTHVTFNKIFVEVNPIQFPIQFYIYPVSIDAYAFFAIWQPPRIA